MLTHGLLSLDGLLRNASVQQQVTRADSADNIAIAAKFSTANMLLILLALAMFYGLCMGSYSLFKPLTSDGSGSADRWLQLVASMIKVPLLYALTIAVTFPSLYVFSTLVGSRLNFHSFVRLMIILLAINLTVLASLGPIVAFFSISTINYPFMQLFNVLMFAIAGGLGLAWLLPVIRNLSDQVLPASLSVDRQEPVTQPTDNTGAAPATGPASGLHTWMVFRIWIVVFCMVGSQLGWVLRPFIGNPDMAFTWFRSRDSNIFLALVDILSRLAGP